MNSIRAIIRHLFRANGHVEEIPPVVFVSSWDEELPPLPFLVEPVCEGGAVAAAHVHPKIKNTGRILVLRSTYEAMDPDERGLTIAHEACHFVAAAEERLDGPHCQAWFIAMGNAGYEDLAAYGQRAYYEDPVAYAAFVSSLCIDVTTNTANCGSCGHTCASGQTCSNGSCSGVQ
jgi:hypothetical protein